MAGNVAALEAAIASAFDVPHGETSQRETIAANLAQAFSEYMETITVVIPSCNASGIHPTGSLE